LNKIDIQIFFFVIAPVFGHEECKLRNVVTGYGDPNIGCISETECQKRQDKEPSSG
jgi:hypothetical protein